MADDVSALKRGAELAGMVAMAIPPPEGPILMAGFNIFGSLLPSPQAPDTTKDILNAIHDLPGLIGNDATLKKARAKLEAITSGIDKVQDMWAAAKGQEYEDTTIDSCRAKFDDLWQLGGGTADILSGLLDVNLEGAPGYLAGTAAVSAYMNLLLGLIIANKVYVELSAGKVAVLVRKRQAGERGLEGELRKARHQVRTDYDQLIVYVRDYSDPAKTDRQGLETLIKNLRAQRPSLANVKTEGANTKGFTGAPSSTETHYIEDLAANPTKQHAVTDTWDYTYVYGVGPSYSPHCLVQQVEDTLPQYRKVIVWAFDTEMADATAIYDKLRAQIDQVGDLPPEDPNQGPKVEWIDAGHPGYWTVPAGEAVCWGVQFQRGSKLSRVIWSDWSVSPGGAKIPKLTLPLDQTTAALTQTRSVYRMVRKNGPGAAPLPMPEAPDDAITVLNLPDNVNEWACDSEPDPALGLPPLPQGAPDTRGIGAASDGDAQAKRLSFTYASAPSDSPPTAESVTESPICASPETGWLTLKSGDALYIPNVGNYRPIVYVRGRQDTEPRPAGGTPTADGDGQMWTWKIP